MFFQALGTLVNPRITNITTGQTMKITGTTTKLVVDNREKRSRKRKTLPLEENKGKTLKN